MFQLHFMTEEVLLYLKERQNQRAILCQVFELV